MTSDKLSNPLLGRIREQRAEILEIAARHKALDVRLFGSVLRGENAQGSDVDFLVRFQREHSIWDEIGLMIELEELLGQKVDIAVEERLKEAYRPHILRVAEPI